MSKAILATITTVAPDIPEATQIEVEDPAAPAIGKWYWVAQVEKEEDDGKWLGCVIHIGSNYVELENPQERSRRVHFDNFLATCAYEPDHAAIIEREIADGRTRAKILMAKVIEITNRLSITTGDRALHAHAESTALALPANAAVETYKKDLVLAKEKTLPQLFEKIKAENKNIGMWMKAGLIPLKAQLAILQPAIQAIKNRIFAVELYAGLVEEVEQIAKGDPAPIGEKIRLMQRRHYMDEECLVDYLHGGMDFRKLVDFEKWLCEEKVRDRILPFPRCVVAFRVRRRHKKRQVISIEDFIQVKYEREEDAKTYLYLRNGDQVFALRTGIEFGEKLFPDLDAQKFNVGFYAKMFAGEVSEVITEHEYQGMVEAEREIEQKNAKLPKNKQHYNYKESGSYKEFTRASIYYDDIARFIADRMAEHNRLVLVVQGLLDRSPVFAPHPPWQIWKNDGFASAVELVYDQSRALPVGDAPDFEAYRKRLNHSIGAGTVTIGQDDAWARREADKEYQRLVARGHGHNFDREHFRPHGDPGPGLLARVHQFAKRAKKATFEWERDRKNWQDETKVRSKITCEAADLFNVDAYRPGDYRQFFDDPRTRADYLQWAGMLLLAEEYHAGHREVAELLPKTERGPSSYEGRLRYQKQRARKAVLGKIVKNRSRIVRTDGVAYKSGLLWIVRAGFQQGLSIYGCDAKGELLRGKAARQVNGMSPSELIVVETPKKEKP